MTDKMLEEVPDARSLSTSPATAALECLPGKTRYSGHVGVYYYRSARLCEIVIYEYNVPLDNQHYKTGKYVVLKYLSAGRAIVRSIDRSFGLSDWLID